MILHLKNDKQNIIMELDVNLSIENNNANTKSKIQSKLLNESISMKKNDLSYDNLLIGSNLNNNLKNAYLSNFFSNDEYR